MIKGAWAPFILGAKVISDYSSSPYMRSTSDTAG